MNGNSSQSQHFIRLQLPNGADYEGEVEEGRPHGRGKLKYSNSERYQGDFFEGMKHGKGKYYYMKGELYIGDWFQNKKHGKGQYFYKNGSIYTGQFADNKKHGHGRIEEPNSSYYDGTFTYNNKDKTGVYYDALDRKKYRLNYDNGRLVSQHIMSDVNQDSNEDQQDQQDQQNDLDKADIINNKGSKKKVSQREILSFQFNNKKEFESEKQITYASHFSPNSINLAEEKKSQGQISRATMNVQHYIEPILISKRSNFSAIVVNEWTPNQVAIWLNQIGFGDCAEEFKQNNIQGDSLLLLENQDLKELGVNALGDRRILLRQIYFLRLIFKKQCFNDPVLKYNNRNLTLDLVRELQVNLPPSYYDKQKFNSNQLINNDHSSSSSSISSDQQIQKDRIQKTIKVQKKNSKDKDEKVAEQLSRQQKKSKLTKVSQYLEKKGIKLTFLIKKQQITIIRPIGRGGYGQVFLGKMFGQQVAVKKYLKKQGFRNRHIGHFIEQLQVISKLNHPCIILYMGMCIYDNEYAMVTQFLSGGSLFDYLHKNKQMLSKDLIIKFCKDVVLGMAFLHEKDVLHCDLKSSNLLIDENENIKLCDFGLSRINSTKNKKKNKGIRVGTPHWMAPEILRGCKYECPADVYSFGIVLWEMMTSRIPYKEFSTAQIIGMVGNDESHHIGTPQYPDKRIINIFLCCTDRDPLKRPTFKDILKDIEEIEATLQSNTLKTLL